MCLNRILDLFKRKKKTGSPAIDPALVQEQDQYVSDTNDEKSPQEYIPANEEFIDGKATPPNFSDDSDKDPEVYIATNDDILQEKINTTNMYSERKDQAAEFEYLERLIRYRINKYFPGSRGSENDDDPASLTPLNEWRLPWHRYFKEAKLSFTEEEVMLLLIGMTPHIQPDLFDRVIESKLPKDNQFYT